MKVGKKRKRLLQLVNTTHAYMSSVRISTYKWSKVAARLGKHESGDSSSQILIQVSFRKRSCVLYPDLEWEDKLPLIRTNLHSMVGQPLGKLFQKPWHISPALKPLKESGLIIRDEKHMSWSTIPQTLLLTQPCVLFRKLWASDTNLQSFNK